MGEEGTNIGQWPYDTLGLEVNVKPSEYLTDNGIIEE